MNNRQRAVVAVMAVAAAAFGAGAANAAGWNKKFVGSLPDASFASVETGPQGEKVRHLPYRDGTGKIDPAHLRAALREWKKVKWQNQADAQPALGMLKNEESKLCATGELKCKQPAGLKKPKVAKTKKIRLPKAPKAASAKPARAPKVAKAPKPKKARHVHVAKAPKPASAGKKLKIARHSAAKKSPAAPKPA